MTVLSRLTARGLHKGVLGGSRGWTAVMVVTLSYRVLRAVTRSKPERIRVTQLHPGDRFEIRAKRP